MHPTVFTTVGKGVGLELQRCEKEVDKIMLIGDGHSKTSSCICRSCFQRYGELEATFVENYVEVQCQQ